MARLARSSMLTTASSVSTALGGSPSGCGPSGRYQARRAATSERRARSAASGSVERRASARSSSTSAASTWPRSMCASAPTSSSRTSSRSSPALSRAVQRGADLGVVARGGEHRAVLAQRVADQVRVVGERGVAQRAHRVAGGGEPRERAAVQVGDAVGPPPPQVGVELGAQQRVDAEPPPALAVAHHQRRVVFEVGQHVARVDSLGERGGQRGGDGVAHAHREQHLDYLVGQRGQDLAHEVVGDGLPVAGQSERNAAGSAASRSEMLARRNAAGQPAVCACSSRCCAGVTCTSARAEHGRGLLGGEGERGRAQLPQLAREAQPPQAQRRVGAAGQHQPQARRPVLQQGREARDRVGVGQLLQVVEHHHERTGHGHQRVDDGVEELRAAARHVGQPHGAQRVGGGHGRHRRECGEHARPEPPVGVVLAVHGEPGDPARLPGDPVGEQERLAVARGCRNEDDLAVAGLVQVVAEAPTRQVHRREVRDCRSDARDRRAEARTGAGAHDPAPRYLTSTPVR